MNILINASNLSEGGGLQVADSICRELRRFPQHSFWVVLSDKLSNCAEAITNYHNVKVIRYNLIWADKSIFRKIMLFIQGRDELLDAIVKDNHIDIVLTIFGPSIWIPKCKHLCGFARPQLILTDSPFYRQYGFWGRLRLAFRRQMKLHAFRVSSHAFFTENAYITDKLSEVMPHASLYTVTNYYNNVFDSPHQWDRSIQLPPFDGFTLLTISANYPHKNLPIIVPTIRHLLKQHPEMHFRFVLTIREEQFVPLTEEERTHILFLGSISIAQCPPLYEQCDAMLLPTLMECFSASYAEAMRMECSVLTTDLEFAHSLCGDAALYYDAVSPQSLANAIYQLATRPTLRKELTIKGKKQLQTFDTFSQRADKLIGILEQESAK